MSRSRLAFQFWPESSEKQALTNLRHLLHELRKALPGADACIEANAKTIAWKVEDGLELDVDVFEEACSQAESACRRGDLAAAVSEIEKALSSYRGDLLPGHYDEWVSEERERLRQRFAGTLQSAVAFLENKRSYDEAIRLCQRLRQLEPTREKTYLDLMRLYALSGDRAKALQIYRDCESTLRKELDVSASERTSELYRKLLSEEPLEAEARNPVGVGLEPELPLQGRQAEWAQLKEAWAQALTGHAQLIVLIGEAGIGKSRLAEELYVSLARQGVAASRTRSYSAEGRLAYAPVCQWLRSPVLYPTLARLEPVWLAEIARVMPELKTRFPDLPMSSIEQGNSQRHLLFEALSRAVLAKEEPVMLLLDDMQWTDQETLEWLRFLLRFAPDGKLLVTGTIREEELTHDHPLRRMMLELSRDGQLSEIQLGPISVAEAASIAANVSGRDLSPREASRLYEATEGNPLFVVESVRAGLRNRLESSLESYEGLELSAALPRKVHAVFATRLAQLTPAALELSRVAAVFGRAFSIEMLVDASGKSEDETIGLLDELWERRILREQEAGMYDFTHDKLREVTYEQISTPKRRLLHRKSSEVLESYFAEDLDAVMAQLASHYEESGQITRAIDAYWKAGLAARELNATRESIRLLEKSLALLSRQPETEARWEKELEICTDLAVCQVAEHGYQSPSVMAVYERSQAICKLLNRPTLAPVLRGLALFNLVFGKLRETLQLGEQLGEYFKEQQESVLYVESEYVLGVANFWLGRFSESRTHLEQSIARYDPSASRLHIAQYAQDPKAVCLCRLGWTLFYLGEIDTARSKILEAMALARSLDDLHTESYVLSFGGQIVLDIGDDALTRKCIEDFDNLSVESKLPYWYTRCEMIKGYVQVVADGDRAGLVRMLENFDICVSRNNTISLSSFLVMIAKAYRHLGESSEALKTLDTLEPDLSQCEETFYDAELARVRGELLADVGRPSSEVTEHFERALSISREQGTLLLELRAALSLAEHSRGSGRAKQAKADLRAVYDRFKEGFESKDLRAARRFLEA